MRPSRPIGTDETGHFPEGVWSTPRSLELTPLYAQRYYGPRTSTRLGFHDFWELAAVLRGKGQLVLESSELPLGTYEVFLVPAGCPHVEISDGQIDLIWIGLRGQDFSRLDGRRIYRLTDRSLAERMEDYWLFAESHSQGVGAELEGLAKAMLGTLIRRCTLDEQPSDVVDRALASINDRFSQTITVSDLASHFGMSEGHFHRLFRSKTGRSPITYLNQVRLKHAEQLLEFTTYPVGEVALRSGFPDALYFSRVFRKQKGRSPSEFRNHTS